MWFNKENVSTSFCSPDSWAERLSILKLDSWSSSRAMLPDASFISDSRCSSSICREDDGFFVGSRESNNFAKKGNKLHPSLPEEQDAADMWHDTFIPQVQNKNYDFSRFFSKNLNMKSLKETKKIEIPDFCITCSIKCEILLAERRECIVGLPNKSQ